jgi:hypothetical protein
MKIILLLLFVISEYVVHAQTGYCPPAVTYQYDAAGNRVVRTPGSCRLADNQDESPTSPGTPNLASNEGFEIKLFPNPTNGQMQVKASDGFLELNNKKIYIQGVKGELIYTHKITDATFILDFSTYAPGYYIVRITADGYNRQWKVQRE